MSDTSSAAGSGPVPPHLAIFTDFDGTLVELAETPDAIVVPADLTEDIEHVVRRLDGAFAVISGRAVSDLDRYLPEGIALAGGHGTERRRADGSRIEVVETSAAAAQGIAERLAPLVREHPALILEPKNGAVALHYRRAPELEEACVHAMADAITIAPGFNMLEGKMVVEARPPGAGKGNAIRAFMGEPPFLGRIPVFFGDDATDEEGFVVAQELGGVGVKIGEGDSAAQVRAADTNAARAIIRQLADRIFAGTPQVQET